MAAAARISLHIHKLVSKKGHWFLKKAKILPKLFDSLVNIVTSFVWLRLYWLRLRRRKPLLYIHICKQRVVENIIVSAVVFSESGRNFKVFGQYT